MFYPSRLDLLPPLITSSICLARAGADVHVIVGVGSESLETHLRRNGVNLTALRRPAPRTIFGKILLRIEAAFQLYGRIWSLKPDCVWFHQSHFINWYPLLPWISKRALVVTHAHELDSHAWPRWVVQQAVARAADLIVVPEQNRGWILKMFSGAKAPVIEIPNRSLEDLTPASGDAQSTGKIFRDHEGSSMCNRFVIYQGAFMPSRCLEELIVGFRMLSAPDIGLILLGGDPASKIYKDLGELAAGDRRIVLMPRIAPPDHLVISKGCIAGVALYEAGSLNSVYCAPNKIYEYAQLGLGMILPNYPGMASLNKLYGLGSLCDPSDPASIERAIESVLDADPVVLREAVRRFLKEAVGPEIAYEGVHRLLGEMRNKQCSMS